MTSSDDENGEERGGTVGRKARQGRTGRRPQAWSHARLLVPTLLAAGALMAVVSSLGAPLIPTLSRADHVSLSTGEWLLTITLLTGALVTPVMGRLADGPRQRDVILFALTCVVAGCVVAAVSDNFTELLVGRGLQGVGLGILPVAMAIARRHLPAEKARRTIATLSVTTAIGVGLGYPVTGLIAAGLGLPCRLLVRGHRRQRRIDASRPWSCHRRSDVPSRRLDTVGAAMLSLVVIGLSVVLSEGGGWGWTSGRSLGTPGRVSRLLAAMDPL